MRYCALLLLITAAGSFAAEPPTAQFLSSALRYQEQICPILDLTYDWSDLKGNTVVCRYARTPDVLYYEKHSSTGQLDVQRSFDRASSQLRALYAYGGSVSGEIGNSIFGVVTMMDIPLCKVQDRFLSDAIAGGLVVGMESVDEHPCWKVDSDQGIAGHYNVWLDPEIGFCPRRLVVSWVKSDAQKIIDFEDYMRLNNDAWFSKTTHEVVTKQGKTLMDMTARAQSVSTKLSAEIPAVVFPKGVPVRNSGLTRSTQ